MTLTELLVAIAIVAVLVSLAWPALQSARLFAKQTHCTANLRGIGSALQAYCADNDGTLPGPMYTGITSQSGAQQLSTYLAPYLGYTLPVGRTILIKEFICPGAPAGYGVKSGIFYASFSTYASSPFLNPWGHPGDPPATSSPMRLTRLAGLVQLSQQWAVKDADQQNMGAGFTLLVPGHPKRNDLFFDGHVAQE